MSDEQIPVLICRDRLGRTADAVLERVDAQAVSRLLKPLLEQDTLLCADGSPVYAKAARDLGVPLKAVNLRAGEGVSYSERQCLRQPSQKLDGAISWGRHPLSGQLPGLAKVD
jgi:hypothetical protein